MFVLGLCSLALLVPESPPWLGLVGLGGVIALAGLVMYQPAVLVHLAAAMLVIAGVFCIVLAWRVRQIGRATTYRYWSEWWWADSL